MLTTEQFAGLLRTNRHAAISRLRRISYSDAENGDTAYQDLTAVMLGDMEPFHKWSDEDLVAVWGEYAENHDGEDDNG